MRHIVFLCALGVEGVDAIIRRAELVQDELSDVAGIASGITNGADNGVCGNRKNVPVRIRDTEDSVYEHIPNIVVKERKREGDGPTYSIGQGSCQDASGKKIKVGSSGWTTAEDIQEDGSSKMCDDICATVAGCQGYMTRAKGECAIIKTRAKTSDGKKGAHCFGTLLGWTEMHTSGRKHAPPAEKKTMRAKDLSRLIDRYEKKAASLIEQIEGAAEKTDKKGTQRGWLATVAQGLVGDKSATDHLHSTNVQQVIERMRGFEKCRGMTRDLDHLDKASTVNWKGKKRTVDELAEIYKALLTEGDSCCQEDCDITQMTMSAETGKRTCEPCKASCAKGEDGLPNPLYSKSYYENNDVDGPIKENYMDGNNIRATIAFSGLGRVCESMTSELQEEKSPELSFCYNRCADAPGGVCRGLKSLARYAARVVQTTLAYDVCPPSASRDGDAETKREDAAYQLCGPFQPNFKGCSLNLEHILMRGTADEVWEADYAMEKAFGGPMCIEDDDGQQWFPKWLNYFTEAKKGSERSQLTKEVVQFFTPYAYASGNGWTRPPNHNADDDNSLYEFLEDSKDFLKEAERRTMGIP